MFHEGTIADIERVREQQVTSFWLAETIRHFGRVRAKDEDERKYYLLYNECGSLAHLILADGNTSRLTKREQTRLSQIVGAIVIGDSDEPLIYYSGYGLIKAWQELIDISHATMDADSQDECEHLRVCFGTENYGDDD